MGDTWKDNISTNEEFFDGKSHSVETFLNSFYTNHQWLIDRLLENGVAVSILNNKEKIQLKYYYNDYCYFPLSGKNTLIQSKGTINSKVGKSIKLIKGQSLYTNFVDFTEKFITKTNIKPNHETYYSDEVIQNNNDFQNIQPIILDINQEIIDYLSKHPNYIYNITSRKFEELVAHILKRFGFEVELTKATRDGGRDIIAHIKNSICSYLTFVECKHFSLENPVGVGIIREVYGVQQIHRANKSLIVTSSYFTKDAIELTKNISNELELKDHNDIKDWLKALQ